MTRLKIAPEARTGDRLFIGLASASFIVALVLALFRRVPGGHRYDLALKLTLPILVLTWLFRLRPERAFGRTALVVVLLAGLGLGGFNLATVDRDSEIVNVYRTVFEALDEGRNPYDCGTIYHRDAGGNVVYGDFNYPPLEIYPYYLARTVAGTWNSTVLTAAILLINLAACGLLALALKEIPLKLLVPYLALIMFAETKTNPSMTLLVACLILLMMARLEARPGLPGRLLLAAAFGLGLATKFLVIPLAAAYYWHVLMSEPRRRLQRVLPDGAVALAVAALVTAPFGAWTVFRSTVLFNLFLKERAVMTTFYPNVLSGPLAWLKLESVFPAAAVLVLGAGVLAAPLFQPRTAMLFAAVAFLMAASTPEPQFLPVVTALFLASVLEGKAGEPSFRSGGGASASPQS